MLKRALMTAVLMVVASGIISTSTQAASPGQPADWQRFYYYPYVYYPHNYQRLPESYDHLYYRYPAEQRIGLQRRLAQLLPVRQAVSLWQPLHS
ncbi:MAG: hypothetical protein R3B90_12295 [Planctomycetaceae bacterium]